ncbi:MAG: MFS transporter [Candidatus Bathyarchaeia archaeon]
MEAKGVVSQRLLLPLAFLTAFTLHLLIFSYSPMISPMMFELGISHVQSGLILSMNILMILILRFPLGVFIDRVGFMKAIKVAMVLVGLFGFLRGFARNYWEILFVQSMLGVGFAFILPCLAKMVHVVYADKVGSATGLYVSGFPVGDIAGLTLTSHLLGLNLEWRLIFKVFGTWALVLALMWLLVDWRHQTAAVKDDFKIGVKGLIRERIIWVLTGICICSMGCYDTVLTWLPHILELKSLPLSEASIIASMLPIGFLASGLTIGLISDRLGLRKPFIIALGSIAGLSISMLILDLKEVLWATVLSAGFSLTGILTLVLIVPTEHPRIRDFVGSSIGIISSLGNSGTLVFPIIAGFLMDRTGSPTAPTIFLAAISFLASMLGLTMDETGRKKLGSMR